VTTPLLPVACGDGEFGQLVRWWRSGDCITGSRRLIRRSGFSTHWSDYRRPLNGSPFVGVVLHTREIHKVTEISTNKRVADFLDSEATLFIGGQRRKALSGKTFDTPNPATGQKLATVSEGDAADIDLAVRAARAAFDDGPWSQLTVSDR
jgi:hypothetical protein